MPHEWRDGDILFSDDRALFDLSVIHDFLSRSYWSAGVPRELLGRGIENSLCFGVYAAARQVGFARAITDRATFAYLADVFILEAHQGRGLGKRLIRFIRAHPDLQGLRRWHLVTRDAHNLYRQCGFSAVSNPTRHMEILVPDAYAEGQVGGSSTGPLARHPVH
ncbi:MAG TPA: GNAT family N-acetyltransferase [Candidatus Acidoferrum sp.]|nr:GNAT family N-acetyltransferase [Candidatus Acidoferrum sp.]